jgi:hypothetical protein
MATTSGTIELQRTMPDRGRMLAVALALAATLTGSFTVGRLSAPEAPRRITTTVNAPAADIPALSAVKGHHHGVVKEG